MRKPVTQTRDALQRLGRVDTRLLVADSYQHQVAQLETRRRSVAFRKLRQAGRDQGSTVETQLNSGNKYEGANRDDAGERDDDARVSDGKSQQASDQKHTLPCSANA